MIRAARTAVRIVIIDRRQKIIQRCQIICLPVIGAVVIIIIVVIVIIIVIITAVIIRVVILVYVSACGRRRIVSFILRFF